jgi:putative Mg2+ transporter-C (MgtC) family protein
MLVGAGAAMFVALGEMLVIELKPFGELQRFDPTRIIEAAAAGVSFLGAGTIFFARGEHRVHGLTTAASLWATATVGMAVGIGRYMLATGATLILFAVLRGLLWLERKGARPAGDE